MKNHQLVVWDEVDKFYDFYVSHKPEFYPMAKEAAERESGNYVVTVKYSRIATVSVYKFGIREEALAFALALFDNNTMVRWITVDFGNFKMYLKERAVRSLIEK